MTVVFNLVLKNVISPIHQHTQWTKEDHCNERWAGGCMPISSASALIFPEQKTPRHLGKDPGRTPHPGGGPQGRWASPWASVLSGAHLFHEPLPFQGPTVVLVNILLLPVLGESRGCTLTSALFTPLAPTQEAPSPGSRMGPGRGTPPQGRAHAI